MLRGLDLILPRGTVTAVVGRSGAGKSTVASLISRFYEPDSGAIWLGGRPATDFTRGEWAKAVALVSQEPVLFSGVLAVKSLLVQAEAQAKCLKCRGNLMQKHTMSCRSATCKLALHGQACSYMHSYSSYAALLVSGTRSSPWP